MKRLAGPVTRRLPLVLSTTALVIALFGATPLGRAVTSVVPPFAKHARTADFATNAGAVNGLKASTRPRPGRLVALGTDGRFPVSVGQVGPQGPQGSKGDKGDRGDQGQPGSAGARGPAGPTGARGLQGPIGPVGPAGPTGVSGWQFLVQGRTIPAQGTPNVWSVECPTGKKALGGGVTLDRFDASHFKLIESGPDGQATGWTAAAVNAGASFDTTAFVWVICAFVS
jgi:Collagen triple helix repeat (20 copies)